MSHKKKYSIRQSTESGQIYANAGNGQRIAIVKGKQPIILGSEEGDDDSMWDDDEDWKEERGGRKDIIAPIGKNTKVYINGKRVK